jgi:hypothetical protein
MCPLKSNLNKGHGAMVSLLAPESYHIPHVTPLVRPFRWLLASLRVRIKSLGQPQVLLDLDQLPLCTPCLIQPFSQILATLAFLPFFTNIQPIPASGPLYLQFPLPGILFSKNL